MGKFKKKQQQANKPPKVNEDQEIAALNQRIRDEAVERGSQSAYDPAFRFSQMPLSSKTLEALKIANLTAPTEIQTAVLPHALAGRDILGAAKTGSGKTLAFLIPLLERLYREKWDVTDGLGALVITPTRELALQIFEVLRAVGKRHGFSAGVVTGGNKDLGGEQERVIGMNILIGTPGRLLHHMEQTPGFDAGSVQVLVLDEADRLLDMGFAQQLDSLLGYLPTDRQTMLFSATQTKSVKDLARLSLNEPEFLAVHDKDAHATPTQLQQNYIVCPLSEKLNVLYSFIKSHLKSKIIVFFSTCSQVRFVYDCFCGMQPGIPITSLHGKIKQEKRTLIYLEYLRKESACLLATDVAARGLDFPSVDWVIQVDAPEDRAMYIHRVGRTARNNANGRALMLLMPSEEPNVVPALTSSGIPIQRLAVNPKQSINVAAAAAAITAARPECKDLAKKAFGSYLRSLQLLPNPQMRVADVSKLPVDEFAVSLGLPFTPPLPAALTSGSSSSSHSMAAGVAGNGNGNGEGDDPRDANRKAKNVNRSLDKLKKQIKEAKEAKRAKREAARAAVAAKAPAASSADSDSEADADDADHLVSGPATAARKKRKLGAMGEVHKELDRAKKAKAKAQAQAVAGRNGSDADNDEEEEELFVPKKKQSHRTAGHMEGDSEEEGEQQVGKLGAAVTETGGIFGYKAPTDVNYNRLHIEATSTKAKKVKPLRITSDGLSKGAIRAGTYSSKIVFDEDGQGDNESSEGAGASAAVDVEEVTAYQLKKRRQLARSYDEDAERERSRVQGKHRDRRLAEREARQKGAAGGAVATLGGAGGDSDSGSDSDDSGSGSGGD